jgi:hypothetical protein
MRRREVITGLTGVAWPLVARAEGAERMRRVGLLIGDAATELTAGPAFREGMAKRGWVEGR